MSEVHRPRTVEQIRVEMKEVEKRYHEVQRDKEGSKALGLKRKFLSLGEELKGLAKKV